MISAALSGSRSQFLMFDLGICSHQRGILIHSFRNFLKPRHNTHRSSVWRWSFLLFVLSNLVLWRSVGCTIRAIISLFSFRSVVVVFSSHQFLRNVAFREILSIRYLSVRYLFLWRCMRGVRHPNESALRDNCVILSLRQLHSAFH